MPIRSDVKQFELRAVNVLADGGVNVALINTGEVLISVIVSLDDARQALEQEFSDVLLTTV